MAATRTDEGSARSASRPLVGPAAVEGPPRTVTGGAVRLRGVSKAYDRGPAVLEEVDLDVAPGSFVCLLGASGCGKSTLLSLVANLERPTAGTVEVPASGAALMFQESALFPWLTAAGNLDLALRLRGVPRRERPAEVERLLDLVRLSGAGGKRVHELSGGMRQRVALARALGQQRSVLLMDEPFAALDAITRDVLHGELERIWRETGTTVVFVTHNVREAVRLGERVLLMSSRPGRIVREWTVDASGSRRIEDASVATLSIEITDHLREEIRRHAR